MKQLKTLGGIRNPRHSEQEHPRVERFQINSITTERLIGEYWSSTYPLRTIRDEKKREIIELGIDTILEEVAPSWQNSF